MIEKSDLSYLGIDFQYAVLKCFIEDPDLFRDIYPILDQNVFSDPYMRQVVGIMKDYFAKIQMVPTYQEITSITRSKAKTEDDIQYFDEIIKKARTTEEFSTSYVKETITTFMKWRKIIALSNEVKAKMSDGWDERFFKKYLNEFGNLANYGAARAVDWTLNEDTVQKVLSQGDEEIIPTGIPEVDNILGGGLRRSNIGLFIAPTGFGKTTFASIIAYNAARAGYKVLQIYFEDEPEDILRKHVAIMSQDRLSHLRNFTEDSAAAFIEQYSNKKKWAALSENLVISKMDDHSTTMEEIEAELIHLANSMDFRPDMIIIDYFSCLRHTTNRMKDKWEAQADCMRKIKAQLAQKYRMAVWIMQQTNRTATDKDNNGTMSNIQGSYEATQPTSVWIELKRTMEQKHEGTADLRFIKNRFGESGAVLEDVIFDNGRCIIDCRDRKEYVDSESPFELHK